MISSRGEITDRINSSGEVYLVVVLVGGVGPLQVLSTVPHDDGNDKELS